MLMWIMGLNSYRSSVFSAFSCPCFDKNAYIQYIDHLCHSVSDVAVHKREGGAQCEKAKENNSKLDVLIFQVYTI